MSGIDGTPKRITYRQLVNSLQQAGFERARVPYQGDDRFTLRRGLTDVTLQRALLDMPASQPFQEGVTKILEDIQKDSHV